MNGQNPKPRLRDDGSVSAELDMNDFYLHETQAQLQLALFGESSAFMEMTNRPLRRAFSSRNKDVSYASTFLSALEQRLKAAANATPTPGGPADASAAQEALPPRVRAAEGRKSDPGLGSRWGGRREAVPSGCPMSALLNAPRRDGPPGPLGQRLVTFDDNQATTLGNALIFAFAGHDTTGHTLTWLTMELARHPEIQRELREEVEDFWARRSREGQPPAVHHSSGVGAALRVGGSSSSSNGEDYPSLEYHHLKELKFMTRCITETLRLWPAVPNGSFRVLQHEEKVTGLGGRKVRKRQCAKKDTQ